MGKSPPVELKRRGVRLRTLAVIPAAVALGAAVAMGVLFANAASLYGQIPQRDGDMPLPLSTVEELGVRGKSMQTAGWFCFGLTVAGLAAAGVMFGLDLRASKVSAAVVGSGGGLTLVLGGAF